MTGPARPLVVVCDWATVEPRGSLLGRRERAYARTLPGGGRRLEWTRSRITIRAALCWATGGPARDVLPDADGRPVPHGARLAGTQVSLAHTGTVVAAVVGGPRTGPVGVDVEPVHPENDLLLPRIGSRQELAVLGELPTGDRATALVCAKEAALKAYRRRSLRLRDYPVSRDDEGRLRVTATGGPPLWLSIRTLPGCLAAVCAASPAPPRVWLARPHALLRLVRPTVAGNRAERTDRRPANAPPGGATAQPIAARWRDIAETLPSSEIIAT